MRRLGEHHPANPIMSVEHQCRAQNRVARVWQARLSLSVATADVQDALVTGKLKPF